MGGVSRVGDIENRIFLIRGRKVMLDSDLAIIYGVSTKRLNEQVRRNSKRFPADFMFQLSLEEAESLRSHFATSRGDVKSLRLHFATSNNDTRTLRSQIVTSKETRGGRRYRPYVFTEHGAVMLSSILHTSVAIRASVSIARAFVRLRHMVIAHKELAEKFKYLEQKFDGHDAQIRTLFDAIRELMNPPEPPRRRIGFQP